MKFRALLIDHMGMIAMAKERITSLHFLLKKLIPSHPGARQQSSEEFASPECGSEFSPGTRGVCERKSCRSQGSGPAVQRGHSEVNVGQKPVSRILPGVQAALWG